VGRFDNPDWRLVAEPPFPAAWLKGLAPAGRPSGRALRAWGLVGAVLLAAAGLLWARGDALVEAAAPLVPPAVTEPLGKAFVAQLVGERRCETPEAKAALAALLARLGTPGPVTLTVADTGFANAFAGPGGQVVLTRGLLEEASGPDEVAGVLAHELGHVARHHPTEALLRQYGLGLLTGSLGGGYADAANMGLLLAASRDAEREADGYALERLKGARISTAGLLGFFERHATPKAARGEARSATDAGRDLLERIGSYATTHPADVERIAAFRAAARGGTPALPPDRWAALKSVCGAAGAGTVGAGKVSAGARSGG
jgi:predicted Zn-dependent protease